MEQDRRIFMKPADGWIAISFYCVVVKTESLIRRYNGDIMAFFNEAGGEWDVTGTLCATAAMDSEDITGVIDLLAERGLQCKTAPVDFYAMKGLCRIPDGHSAIVWGTLDDGELEIRYDSWNPLVRLKDPERKGGPAMLGAIAGDIIGSVYERHSIKKTNFPLFDPLCRFTDDTVLTVAIADAVLTGADYGSKLREWYNLYPDRSYGPNFRRWAASSEAYQGASMGNGAAMRVSPIGFAFDTLEEVLEEAGKSAEPSHNHPEAIKGARAVAAAVFCARKGLRMYEIKEYISRTFSYDLDRTVEEIRPAYRFDGTCQGSVPEAIIAFLASADLESAIRIAVSLGGDSDTIAGIAGAIAFAYYKIIPAGIAEKVMSMLDGRIRGVVQGFAAQHGILV
ncbi:MAG TPA: ADP-ribosylglycohydrolase family protein [Syntrophorhabdaceae bacterium]|nr:ADP-ribosylglycohydrolase family protein [Syntrophorhabdaceae bacterium]HQM80775.1 ADP-ribosylglycohydrolase family protein [Syntrophorhabdaceae bacterium]